MKNLVLVDIRIAMEVDDALLAKLRKHPENAVCWNCFTKETRSVLDARIVDEEVVDGRINILKLIDERYSTSDKVGVEVKKTDPLDNFEVRLP